MMPLLSSCYRRRMFGSHVLRGNNPGIIGRLPAPVSKLHLKTHSSPFWFYNRCTPLFVHMRYKPGKNVHCGLAYVISNAFSSFQIAHAIHCQGWPNSTCGRMHSLQTLAASIRFQRPAVKADAGFVLHHTLCIAFLLCMLLATGPSPTFHRPNTVITAHAQLWHLFEKGLQRMACK